MSSGRRPVSMAIWVAALTPAGPRASRPAHSTVMISGGRSRPGSPRPGAGGGGGGAPAGGAGPPGRGLPGPGQAQAADPGQRGADAPADDVAVVAADRPG